MKYDFYKYDDKKRILLPILPQDWNKVNVIHFCFELNSNSSELISFKLSKGTYIYLGNKLISHSNKVGFWKNNFSKICLEQNLDKNKKIWVSFFNSNKLPVISCFKEVSNTDVNLTKIYKMGLHKHEPIDESLLINSRNKKQYLWIAFAFLIGLSTFIFDWKMVTKNIIVNPDFLKQDLSIKLYNSLKYIITSMLFVVFCISASYIQANQIINVSQISYVVLVLFIFILFRLFLSEGMLSIWSSNIGTFTYSHTFASGLLLTNFILFLLLGINTLCFYRIDVPFFYISVSILGIWYIIFLIFNYKKFLGGLKVGYYYVISYICVLEIIPLAILYKTQSSLGLLNLEQIP